MNTVTQGLGTIALAVACAGATGAPGEATAAPDTTRPSATAQDTIIPAGYGTLKQDEITMSLRSGPLLIKVTPLHEGIIRLLAPDTYQRLHNLAEARREEAERKSGVPGVALFMVSFFSYSPDVEYTAEDVQLSHQGARLRPVAVLPITPDFGRQRLNQQETQAALYAFDARIDYQLAITVHYGFEQSDQWVNVLSKLEVERSRVRARAGGG